MIQGWVDRKERGGEGEGQKGLEWEGEGEAGILVVLVVKAISLYVGKGSG